MDAGCYQTAERNLAKTSPDEARRLDELLTSVGMERGRLLDVGCATGSLIYHLWTLGWQVAGTDINADAVRIGARHGLDVRVGGLDDAPYEAESFDVVHLGDVLEHLPRPREALRAATRLLRQGGLLVVRCPNGECGFARATLGLSRRLSLGWPQSQAPYHLYEFSPAALRQLAASTGFEVVRLDRWGRVPFWYMVGATGSFDGLKKALKEAGRPSRWWKLALNGPKIFVVAATLFPFWAWGTLYDFATGSGSGLRLVARRCNL